MIAHRGIVGIELLRLLIGSSNTNSTRRRRRRRRRLLAHPLAVLVAVALEAAEQGPVLGRHQRLQILERQFPALALSAAAVAANEEAPLHPRVFFVGAPALVE